MHQILSPFSLIICIIFLIEAPISKAMAQATEIQPVPEIFSDIEDSGYPIAPVTSNPVSEAGSDPTMQGNILPLRTGSPWNPLNNQMIVFARSKEVVAPSMKLLSNDRHLTDPANCGVGRSPCLLVFGDMDSEFYAIKQRTFARHAQGPLPGSDFGARGVKNMLAANFLSQRVLNRPYILQLGETGVDYWLIPKCGTSVRFKKRIPVQQFPNHAEPIQLKC